MQAFLFYLFAAIAIISAFLVIANPFSRNPITSALFLVITMVSLSGLFILLHAFFLGAIQILVYAGAVMVLFLFVLMLMDLREEGVRNVSRMGWVAALLGSSAMAVLLIRAMHSAQPPPGGPPGLVEGSTASLGRVLFTQYILPFEILSVLLLAAMVGVILLSKRRARG